MLTKICVERMWDVHSVYVGGPQVWWVGLCRGSGVVTGDEVSNHVEIGVF